LSRPVVLKVLDQVSKDRSEDLIERFIAEGRIIASLRHPNIITIFDIGIADSSMYISMEYVQGGDLKQRMELPISADEALQYLAQVGSALAEAHKHGIVHRDVKPANILFRDENTPLLTDFGIAKQVDVEHDLTSTGIFLGSPNYVSPEQADGVKIDGRADIYSLGCIFYEMLTSKKPYLSDSVIDIVIQHKQAPVPTLPAEYTGFQPLLERMMAKRREDRFADAENLILEVDKLRRERNRRARLVEKGESESADSGPNRQRRAKKILTALMLLGLVMFSSLKYIEIRLKEPARPHEASTSTTLGGGPAVATGQGAVAPAPAAEQGETAPALGVATEPPPPQVIEALVWLGRQSLDEYNLTYPPKKNAYYYFNRLLEIDPGNKNARAGILEIADRYAVLAEQSLAKNEMEKTAAYVEIGLRINPRNQGLLALKHLTDSKDASLGAAIRSLFTGK